MSRVLSHTLHGHTVDRLEGRQLLDGDKIIITWSDKITPPSKHVVRIDRRVHEKDRLAYVTVPFQGTTSRLYLRFKNLISAEFA